MFATEAQQLAGVDPNSVMPTIASGTKPGTELTDLEFPHLHQGLNGLNLGFHHPTPDDTVALYINVHPETAQAFFDTPPGLGLKIVETEVQGRPFAIVIFVLDFDGEEIEFDLVFGLHDPTNLYDLRQLIDTPDPSIHLLIGATGQLYYGFGVQLPLEDEGRKKLAAIAAKYS